jgi:hypothetical protein
VTRPPALLTVLLTALLTAILLNFRSAMQLASVTAPTTPNRKSNRKRLSVLFAMVALTHKDSSPNANLAIEPGIKLFSTTTVQLQEGDKTDADCKIATGLGFHSCGRECCHDG